ncbi:MerR family transcriptional regulator [Catenulispora sp. NL8]|uniref:MerR family transcriptional regulator n=1 Tax=Catenulispora pinistramenti TaxID=2705254 RepID=A0ABS5KYX1_9ACTN|nr:MerR family transcriptional regulator [Catenulispora pinistramenti]MBS2551224.1 MerR family transcriptional regulator [Catenulispora pinistramenti]
MSGVSGEALTIGEVIGRLAADFPDLTVSKIRYLESGGLISPGRTPAGYRRFTEEDVEKLRWVLAAQRDQYLPLKVIRQHLAADGPRVSLGDADAIVAALTAGAEDGAAPDPDVEAEPGAGLPATADPDHPALPPAATLTPPLPPLPHPRGRAATVADPEFYLTARADVGELHLGPEALARTAGVSESFLADLVAYGLLPNARDYGGDAVFIARSASALAEYGLEPRHLRSLMTGARNTAGLLGTLLPARRHDGVTGTARQAAATRAATRTAEASAAVVKLYGALLRAELAADTAPAAPAAQPAPGASAGTQATHPYPAAQTRQAPPAAPPAASPDHAPSAAADTSPAPSAPASRASSRNPGMPGGPAAR